MWADVYRSNSEAVADEARRFARSLEAVADLLESGGDVAAWNDDAREARRRLLESDLTGQPVHELRLTVPNRPGIVASVALALGRAGVNIVDLTLAPASDMLTGAMTLWIAGDGEAARATELIGELGFPVAEL
jgi:prephenate dehydrogenase